MAHCNVIISIQCGATAEAFDSMLSCPDFETRLKRVIFHLGNESELLRWTSSLKMPIGPSLHRFSPTGRPNPFNCEIEYLVFALR